MPKVDWESELRNPIYDMLDEMGNGFVLKVVEGSERSASGKKIATSVKEYTGVAVMGGYATMAEQQDSPLIKAGDVKFVTQFDDREFEPSEKLDETFVFGGINYKVAYARGVNPAGDMNIIWVLFSRRVN